MLTLGFTFSYGAMFSKVWRVHRLTTKGKRDLKVKFRDSNKIQINNDCFFIATSSALEIIFNGGRSGLC